MSINDGHVLLVAAVLGLRMSLQFFLSLLQLLDHLLSHPLLLIDLLLQLPLLDL